MAKIPFSILSLLCVVQCLFIVETHARLVPALYVFGDSLSDPGNNIFLPGSIAKPVFKPYAIDFPNGTFGRFTNGFTIADYMAIKLGLPLPRPILDPHGQTTNFTDGFNYASSSAGILRDTGRKIAGANLCLEQQVELFKKTATEFLVSRLRNQKVITRHLQKSIYLIMIGTNDYSINYNDLDSTNINKLLNGEQFAELLVNKLGCQVEELYKLGARKFVVSEIGPVGCTPGAIKVARPPTRCAEYVNGLVSYFNKRLAEKTTQFSKTLKGATFVTIKGDFLAQLIENPKHYGFKDASSPCCTVGKIGIACEPNVPPCRKRQSHIFFDDAHTTDAANKFIAKSCFKGIGACTPINIRQLAKLR